jgi:hypothetical protein
MFVWLISAVLLTARLVWQLRPNRGSCALFWGIAMASLFLGWSSPLSQYVLSLGILCNAFVTLANGGFMPVAAHRRLNRPARSLWVQRQSGQRLLFLADNFGTRSIRFSVGDVFILIGIVLAFLSIYGLPA